MSGYFDYNATAPFRDEARSAWEEAGRRYWQNPSGLYRSAAGARRRLEDAREALADVFDAGPERVVFTSGATEANNAVMRHAALAGGRALIGATEHPCVRAAARRWFGEVVETRGEQGAGAAVEGFALVSLMAANNETGALLPWRGLRDRCRAAGVPFHCDAAQWIGKLPVDGLGACDYLTGSAHKFGGPRGAGFVLVPEGASEFALQVGGPQENGLRAGTEDVAGAVGMVAALEAAIAGAPGDPGGRDRFERELVAAIPGTRVIGAEGDRLWNTSMVLVPAEKNLKWLTRLDARGFQVSTGSACSAGRENPSHVMEAEGLAYDEMGRVIRVSGGWDTRHQDWRALLDAFVQVAQELGTPGTD
ncbi:cysteine desulfurase family protein [soil metagenome]